MTIYIVVPCYNEQDILDSTIGQLTDKLESLESKAVVTSNSKLVFVDDGSNDTTWDIICNAAKNTLSVIGVRLSKNEGHQNALMAGMLFSLENDCDAVITIDADLQQDINAIDVFIEKFQEGNDIVYGVRNSRDTDGCFKRISANAFYRFMNHMGCNVIKNHADYRLLSRRALAALAEYRETNLFLRGIIPMLGFKSCIVSFDVFERAAGDSKYTLRKMLHLAANGITAFSVKPMHIVMGTGIMISLISIAMILYNVIAQFCGKTVSGWASLSISIWLLMGVSIFSTGLMGEYIGRIYLEIKQRPRYNIQEVIKNTHAK